MRRAALVLAVVLAAAEPAPTRQIDPIASKAAFSVTHVFVEHVTGTLPIVSGEIVLPPGSMVPTSIVAVLDPTKMKTGEADRDGVLQTPDWFDTSKYPKWTFTSTKISPGSSDDFTVDGTLTMHGVSRPERLAVTANGTPLHPIYHAVGEIDRHTFGMSITRLDPAIGNPVEITLDVVLRP